MHETYLIVLKVVKVRLNHAMHVVDRRFVLDEVNKIRNDVRKLEDDAHNCHLE